MAKPPVRLNRSRLEALLWEVEGLGVLSVRSASGVILRSIDDDWPALRSPADVTGHWRWSTLGRDKPERFVITNRANAPVAIWCSSRKACVALEGQPYYRLDFVEVHPSLRGRDLGTFTVGVIGARALELGARGMVLETFPEVAPFYLARGARPGAPGRWRTTSGLLPLTIPLTQLHTLKDAIDELLVEAEKGQ